MKIGVWKGNHKGGFILISFHDHAPNVDNKANLVLTAVGKKLLSKTQHVPTPDALPRKIKRLKSIAIQDDEPKGPKAKKETEQGFNQLFFRPPKAPTAR